MASQLLELYWGNRLFGKSDLQLWKIYIIVNVANIWIIEQILDKTVDLELL